MLEVEEKKLEVEMVKVVEQRELLAQTVYRNLCRNEFIGDGKKINRVNRFTQLLDSLAKSASLGHKALLQEIEQKEEKFNKVLDLLERAQILDQDMNRNKTHWNNYCRETLEAHGQKVRRSNSNG